MGKKSKTSLQFIRYTLQNQDTTILSKGTWVHPRTVFYRVNALDSDSVYPFRLEFIKDENQFEFGNFNNQELNKIVYHFTDKETLSISHFSKNNHRTHFSHFTKR